MQFEIMTFLNEIKLLITNETSFSCTMFNKNYKNTKNTNV